MTGATPADASVSLQKGALLALRQARTRIEALEYAGSEPLAIIGVACRFPGNATTPDAYWQLLRSGTDAISEVPADRWDINSLYDASPEAPGKMITRRGGFLAQVDQFDPQFFGISPREAQSMDPQQRLVLEVSWEALERAGIAADKLSGGQTGVFLGAGNSDYSLLAVTSPDAAPAAGLHRVTGSAINIIAGRVSYTLGLRGPSMVVDTACSSALVALHLAAQSLHSGECDLALAGGVSLMLAPELSVMFSKAHMLAPDGRCKTFDAAADGFARGEGCGIIVLRRLSDALAHDDPVLAVVRGSAVNQDGRSSGLTAPNGQAQQAVIRKALANAHVTPAQIGYVETHGTGTALGDPIEVQALAAVLSQDRAAHDPLLIGAVKTNIGHLEAASGMAGLIKAVLALQHQEIPPNLHFHRPSPHIPWDELPVAVPTDLVPWRPGDRPRLAGVSSFGFSGTNAHVILGEAPPRPAALPGASRPVHLLCLSAKDETALRELAGSYQRHLATAPSASLADITHTAHTGRAHFTHRAALTAGSLAGMRDKLGALATSPAARHDPAGMRAPGAGSAIVPGDPPIVFLFSGQGAQYPGMSRQLYETLPAFRSAMQRCDDLLRPHLDRSLLSVLYPEAAEGTPLDDTTYTQPALFALEYALAEVWRSWGIAPSAVLGHSVGEYVASCVAGVLSLEDALSLVARRGRLMGDLPRDGAMAAVFAPEAEVAAAIAPLPELAIAAVNGPENTVISGAKAAVAQISASLRARGTRVQELTVSHAFHSPLMDPVLDALERAAGIVAFAEPRIDLVTNLTGERLPAGRTLDPQYLRRQARETVRFGDGIATLHQLGYRTFVEIGPRPVLLGMGRRCLPDDAGAWLPSLRKNRGDWQSMLDSLGALYERGATVDWENFDRGFPARRVILPTYPFQRQRYWAVEQAQAPHTNAPRDPLTPRSPATAGSAAGPQATGSWLYQTEWRPQPAAVEQLSGNLAGHWIILADSGGVGRQLAAALEKQEATCDLIFAGSEPGEDALFPIPPDCRGLIHLWGLDAAPPAETNAAFLQQDQARHCTSVLRSVQALGATRLPVPPRLWIVTRGAQPVRPAGQDVVAVTQSPLWGLGKVIALEKPEVWGGLIDLDPAAPAADQAARLLADLRTHRATPELPAGGSGGTADGGPPPHEDQVAWRDGKRYVARLTRAGHVLAQTSPLRADATYAITGGTGGLGSAVAAWMTQQGARNIALIGRSATADSPSARALAQTGIRVLAIQADVTQPGQVADALRQIETTMPPLRGIVHAAGVLDDGLLLSQDWARFHRVLAPKVEGAWNLHALTRALSLDFFVLFSSTAALLGSPGQASYAAANSFLDALAHHRRSLGLPAMAINWGPWDLGMAADASAATRQRWANMGVALLAPEQGLRALASLLGGPAAQVAVLRADWAALTAPIADTSSGLRALLTELTQEAGRPAPASGSQLVPPPRPIEELAALPPGRRLDFLRDALRRQAGAILGMAPENVPADRNLPELGMDSLMIMDMATAIKQDFQLALYPRELYDHPTIDSMTAYLDTELSTLPPAPSAGPGPLATTFQPGPGVPWVPGSPPRRAAGQSAAPERQLVTNPRSSADIVFLLSGPRSGSTLLRVMLAGHPQLFCPPELHLLPFDTIAQQQRELGRSYLAEGLQRALMELRGGDAATAKALLDSWIADDIPIHEVYTRLAQLAAPQLLVDKSPTYAASLDTLRRAETLFGKARYLFLVRHPYAAVESFTRTRMHKLIGVDHDDPFAVAEQVWIQTNQNMTGFLRQVDPQRQHVVRFEDLVRQPEKTAGDICAFLGIPADPAVLRPYEGGRMTDGVHGQSLAIGDPNFLHHDHIEPELADTWKTITLPRPLGPAARQLAATFGYTLPGLTNPVQQHPAEGSDVDAGSQASGDRPAPAATQRAHSPAREYSVTAHGLRLRLTEWGPEDGPAIVALHGILDHSMTWEDVAIPLASQGYRFIAPDQRGHGCSAHAAAGAYHLLNYVADLDALLNDPANRIVSATEAVVLVGHSMGAAVAATYASLRPRRASALALIEGLMPGEPSDEEFARMLESRLQYLTSTPEHAVLPDATAAAQRLRQAMPSLSPEHAYRMAGRITRPCGDGVCWTWDPALLTRADLSYDTLSITPARYRALLARITIPVTLIYADAGNPHLAQLRTALPQAATEVLPGGHNLQLDAPEALAGIIARSAAPASIAPSAR